MGHSRHTAKHPPLALAKTRVLVLGGAGFVGRHAVAALLKRGHEVIIASRRPERIARRLPVAAHHCARTAIRLERFLDIDAWLPVLRDVDCVVNCVGILRPVGRATHARVHCLAVAALAAACARLKRRLIHVSALGLGAHNRSGFLTSKRAGEAALRASGGDWHLVRPSLLDGDGGYGAAWIRRVADWPLHPAPASGRIAVLDVRDLGEALAEITSRASDDGNRVYELGGTSLRTLAEHLAAMATHAGPRARRWPVPAWLARLTSHVCDLFHLTPFSFGHYELLRANNVPRVNRLPELLGRPPRDVRGRPTRGANGERDLGLI